MILVFRKGSSHTFHGIDCEVKRINAASLPAYEKDGWTVDHTELAKAEVPRPTPVDTDKTPPLPTKPLPKKPPPGKPYIPPITKGK